MLLLYLLLSHLSNDVQVSLRLLLFSSIGFNFQRLVDSMCQFCDTYKYIYIVRFGPITRFRSMDTVIQLDRQCGQRMSRSNGISRNPADSLYLKAAKS